MNEDQEHLRNVGAGKSMKNLEQQDMLIDIRFIANRSAVDFNMDEFFSLQSWDGIILYP